MARYIGPVCRLCRRESTKLFLKGDRCFTDKCSVDRRPYPPGQHGQRRTKFTEYGIRLREKQKVSRIYGVLERQFRRYFKEADRGKSVTGEALLSLLERRLDSVCYRLGFASTRAEARHLVRHKHVSVNGRTVNIPSYRVKPGDVVQVREAGRKMARVNSALDAAEKRGIPTWLELNRSEFTGSIKSHPHREEITLPIQEQLIVEFYSR
jgi:small subunit ribosomal protein S4